MSQSKQFYLSNYQNLKGKKKPEQLPHKCQMIFPTAGISQLSAFRESYYEALITLCYLLVTPKKENNLKMT